MIAESDSYDKPNRTNVLCYVMLFHTDPTASFDISTFGSFEIRFIFEMSLRCTRSNLFLSIKIVEHGMQELKFSAVQPLDL